MSDIGDEQSSDVEPIEEDILLVTAFPGPRIFTLNDGNHTTMLGVLMDETDDSFLVALPCRLTENMGIVPFVPAPYFRLMKHAVESVMFQFGMFKEHFLTYALGEGKDLYPPVLGFMEDEDLEFGNDSPLDVQEEDEAIREAAGEAAKQLSVNTDSGTQEKAQGMSDEELEEYLMNKYKNGDLYSGPGNKQ